jgi:hypothetical protein
MERERYILARIFLKAKPANSEGAPRSLFAKLICTSGAADCIYEVSQMRWLANRNVHKL